MKANFKTKTSNKKEQEQLPTKTEEDKTDKNFTDLWSFRSKKNQKL